MMSAHRSQLHAVPDGMDDRSARSSSSRWRARPLGAARARSPTAPIVLVVGAGTVGLLTLLALREFANAGPRHRRRQAPRQRGAAQMAGADEVVRPEHAPEGRAPHANPR